MADEPKVVQGGIAPISGKAMLCRLLGGPDERDAEIADLKRQIAEKDRLINGYEQTILDIRIHASLLTTLVSAVQQPERDD